MLRTLALAAALAMSLAIPNMAAAHGYYGGGWRGGPGQHWGYGGPGWHRGWARPYGYGGGYYYGGDSCWRWIDGEQVWVC